MTNSITPPPNLVRQWIDEPQYMTEDQLGKRMYMISLNEVKFREIISKASQYGADQELEACCKWLPKLPPWSANDLRKHRRPKPPSLKEQALLAIDTAVADDRLSADVASVVRRALDAE